MANPDIQSLEQQIFELTERLAKLRAEEPGEEVQNYTFSTLDGETTLLDLFGEQSKLMMIHNMGQGYRFCTLWADGFNGFLPHLESAMSVILTSKDAPKVQRNFANNPGWRFRLASHGGGQYIEEQTVMADAGNMPGAVFYERAGDTIVRKNSCVFGPGDLYCSHWNLLALAGLSEQEWTPQFSYWKRPESLDDGGENLIE